MPRKSKVSEAENKPSARKRLFGSLQIIVAAEASLVGALATLLSYGAQETDRASWLLLAVMIVVGLHIAMALITYLNSERRDQVRGDLAEGYANIQARIGKVRAYFWLMSQVVRLMARLR
jgi:hypothetical protein